MSQLTYFHCIFLYESLIAEDILLPGAAVELGGGQNVGNGAESMEQHGWKVQSKLIKVGIHKYSKTRLHSFEQ